MKKIAILMAAFNGEEWIEEQLHSIFSQAIKEKGHSFRYSSYPCWFMSRKFSPNFEGSLNLGFGFFSFYTRNYEQFRAPKR